ncbi:MAG: FAD:protein FMN transferase [Mahellales bacterium]|jgi:thiamine biosynthesis lipoprotein
MKRVKTCLCFTMAAFIVGLCLWGCRNQNGYQRSGFMLGTIVELTAYGPKAEAAVEAGMDRIKEIEQLMSVNIKESDISRINQNAGKGPVKIHKDTFNVIQRGLYYSKITNGAFDISILPLVRLWGIGTDQARVPDEQEISKVLPLVNYKNIILYPASLEVELTKEGMALDLGGIAKGYAADEVGQVFRQRGIKNAIINLGGDILLMGGKPDDALWKVGIQNPFKPQGQYMAKVEVKDKAVVTSGDYERYFEQRGIRYHHILDPVKGCPARSGVISVSIIAEHPMDADALSTAVFVLGPDKGMELIEGLENVEGIIIKNDRSVLFSSGLKKNFELTDKEFRLGEEG